MVRQLRLVLPIRAHKTVTVSSGKRDDLGDAGRRWPQNRLPAPHEMLGLPLLSPDRPSGAQGVLLVDQCSEGGWLSGKTKPGNKAPLPLEQIAVILRRLRGHFFDEGQHHEDRIGDPLHFVHELVRLQRRTVLVGHGERNAFSLEFGGENLKVLRGVHRRMQTVHEHRLKVSA